MNYIEELAEIKYQTQLAIDNINKSLYDAIALLDNTSMPDPIGIKVYLKNHPYNADMKTIHRVSDNQMIGVLGYRFHEYKGSSFFIKIHGIRRNSIVAKTECIPTMLKEMFAEFCLIPTNIDFEIKETY